MTRIERTLGFIVVLVQNKAYIFLIDVKKNVNKRLSCYQFNQVHFNHRLYHSMHVLSVIFLHAIFTLNCTFCLIAIVYLFLIAFNIWCDLRCHQSVQDNLKENRMVALLTRSLLLQWQNSGCMRLVLSDITSL